MQEIKKNNSVAHPVVNDKDEVTGHMIMCPACEYGHLFDAGRWSFNGDVDRPTFSPSMLSKSNHSWSKISSDQWVSLKPKTSYYSYRVPRALLPGFPADRSESSLEELAMIMGIDPILTEVTKKVETWMDTFPIWVCHSFVRDGKIEFLGDCTHEFAGKTVDLEAW